MNPRNKNIAIIVTIVVVLVAVFSFKTYVLDAGNTDAAKAELNKKLQEAPPASVAAPTKGAPVSMGIHGPGNKNR